MLENVWISILDYDKTNTTRAIKTNSITVVVQGFSVYISDQLSFKKGK